MTEENIKHKTKVGVYWTLINQGAMLGMNFIVSIVMARLLAPSDYGITALPSVFMAVAGIFMDSGFGLALIRKSDVSEKDLSTSFYYSIGMGIFMYSILFATAPFIADFYNTPVLTPLLRVTALTLLLGPLNTPMGVILQRRLDFKTPTKISLIVNIIGAIAGISSAYAGMGLWSLIIANLVSGTSSLIITWCVVRWIPREKFNKESFQYLWNFGNKLIGANLIATLYDNVAPIFIGKYCSTHDLGLFNRANGYAILPINQISGMLQRVSFPVLSKFVDDDEMLNHSYRRMIRLACFVSFPVMFLVVALARPIVIVMITEKWEACIVLLQILCFERMWWPFMSLNKNILQIKGRSDYSLKLEMLKKPLLLCVVFATIPFGIKVYCYGCLLQGVISLTLNTYYSRRLVGLSIFEQLRDVAHSYLLAIFMMGIVFVVTYSIPSLYLQILVGGVVGLVFYLGIAWLFKFNEIHDLLYMLKRK